MYTVWPNNSRKYQTDCCDPNELLRTFAHHRFQFNRWQTDPISLISFSSQTWLGHSRLTFEAFTTQTRVCVCVLTNRHQQMCKTTKTKTALSLRGLLKFAESAATAFSCFGVRVCVLKPLLTFALSFVTQLAGQNSV